MQMLIPAARFRSSVAAGMFSAAVLCCSLLLSGCSQSVTLYSVDGEYWQGKWRHARDETGLVQISGAAGEILRGTFKRVSRQAFFETYEKTFGTGAITADGPDVSSFGNAFGGMLAGSNTLPADASGQNFNPASGRSTQMVSGPLFYWTANLQGDRKTTLHCFLIGSAYTGHGLGRCKGTTGKDYTIEF